MTQCYNIPMGIYCGECKGQRPECRESDRNTGKATGMQGKQRITVIGRDAEDGGEMDGGCQEGRF